MVQKYFCCPNLSLQALTQMTNVFNSSLTSSTPDSSAITKIASFQNITHFLAWAKHYYNSTPLLNGELTKDVTWFIKVTDTKTGVDRYFFAAHGETSVTSLRYSFVEVKRRDVQPKKKETEIMQREGITVKCEADIEEGEWGRCEEVLNSNASRDFEISEWSRNEDDKKSREELAAEFKEKLLKISKDEQGQKGKWGMAPIRGLGL
jgi:hypothetical protein